VAKGRFRVDELMDGFVDRIESEARAILEALDNHGGHRARTARSLGISERTLRYRLASMRENGMLAAGGEA